MIMEKTPIIKNMKVTKPFTFIWMMYISNVYLSEHCKAGLGGITSKHFHNNMEELTNLRLDESEMGKAYYICGVSKNFVWKKNFHCAFVYDENEEIDIDENGIKLHIKNAKRIEITPNDIIPGYPHSKERLYKTCRNWQFSFTFMKMFYPWKYEKMVEKYSSDGVNEKQKKLL
jgi:hypothetical protein